MRRVSQPRLRTTKPVTGPLAARSATVAVIVSFPGIDTVEGADTLTPLRRACRGALTVQVPRPPPASASEIATAPPFTGNETDVGAAKSSGSAAPPRPITPP